MTAEVDVPTIGIGAGPACDGQVIVLHDLLGLVGGQGSADSSAGTPSWRTLATEAVKAWGADVRAGRYPSDAESYHASAELREALDLPPDTRAARDPALADRSPTALAAVHPPAMLRRWMTACAACGRPRLG